MVVRKGTGIVRVAGYVRVSTPGQVERWSLDGQREAIRMRCQQEGWQLVEVYSDEGLSAWQDKAEHRQAYQRMLADAQAGKFDVVVVHSIDRMARSLMTMMNTLKLLRDYDIAFLSIMEALDFSQPYGKALMAMLAVLAEIYSDNLSEHAKKGLRQRRSKGLHSGRPPYGYQLCDDSCLGTDEWHQYMHPNPEKSKVVPEIFKMYINGKSQGDIADWLTTNGYRSNGVRSDRPGVETVGNLFTASSLSRLMRNPLYVGQIKTEEGYGPGVHKPILDSLLFDQVQHILQNNTKKRTRAGRKSILGQILSRIAKCHLCNRLFHASVQGEKQYHYLRMRSPAIGQPCICIKTSFTSRYIEADIDEFFRTLELPEDWKTHLINKFLRDSDAEAALREQRRIDGMIERTKELYIVGDLEKDAYDRKMAQFEHRRSELIVPSPDALVEAGENLEDFSKVWDSSTRTEKSGMLRQVLDAVYIDSEARTIYGLVPRPSFADLLKSVAELPNTKLALLTGDEGRQFVQLPGRTHELPTSFLKFVHTITFELDIGKRIQERREAWGMRQIDLANYLGFTRAQLSCWEADLVVPSLLTRNILGRWFAEDPPERPERTPRGPTLGQRMKCKRERIGMGKEELARRFGGDALRLRLWEQGRNFPTPTYLARIVVWLHEAEEDSLGQKLRKKRGEMGISQKEFARRFRIDRDTVNEWEEDLAPPSPSDIERLTVWLAVRTQGPSRERDEYTTLIQPMQRKRERLGISRAELSISLGVSKPQVYNWEEGHACPSPDNQEKIARWLAEDVPVRVSRKDQVRDLIQRMIERRLLMQMSRSKMASSIGVTSSNVYNWEEDGILPNKENCEKISEWLDRTTNYPAAQLLPGINESLKAA